MMKPAIALDFDGVIHCYSKGWHDGTIYDEPVSGVREFIRKQQKHFHVVVYSTRLYDREIEGVFQPSQLDEMIGWLNEHKIPFDQLWTRPGLPHAVAYIDHKAVRFNGDWAEVEKQLK